MSEDFQSEDVVGKYKRLLALARSSLEANQTSLSLKDKQIVQLTAALEEEKSSKNNKRNSTKEEDNLLPKNLLRRVEINDCIWIFVEYESVDKSWICFHNELDLDNFIQKFPGMPLVKPQRCLSVEESVAIETESKKKVDRIVEEFRRYKVKSEISRKQVESKQQQSLETNRISFSDNSMINNQEEKWKIAYEKVVRENELLRSRNNDALLLNQCRERLEICMKENTELKEKLKIYTGNPNTSSSSNKFLPDGKSLETAFIELRDEYKEFRQRFSGTTSRIRRYDETSEKIQSSSSDSLTLNSDHTKTNSRKIGLTESKIQHIRQMILQYMMCKDPLVTVHIEDAIMAMLRFSEHEKVHIRLARRPQSNGTLTSFLTYFD